MLMYDEKGKARKLQNLAAVERLETLKRKHGSNPWPAIEECINIWKSTSPAEWKSYLFEIDEVRKTRKNKEYAWNSSKGDPEHGGILRYTLDIPQKVMFMIRCLYDSSELPMNREFFQEFARRFPLMKVAEKL